MPSHRTSMDDTFDCGFGGFKRESDQRKASPRRALWFKPFLLCMSCAQFLEGLLPSSTHSPVEANFALAVAF